MSGASPVLEQLLSEVARGASSDAASFDCVREGRVWRLKIWGGLAPEWAGNLSVHCHAARIGIIEGDALRVRDRIWVGAFLIAEARGASRPDGFDFLQMARRRTPVIPSLIDPEILELSIDRDPEAGSAGLRITGRDQLGFLAYVLSKIALCELEPHRISLRTTPDGLARDQFVLFGSEGTPAKSHAVAKLARALEH